MARKTPAKAGKKASSTKATAAKNSKEKVNTTMTDRISIDINDVTTPFAVLDDGEYPLRLGDAEFQKSKKGRDMMKCRWETPDPENPTDTVFVNDYVMLDNRSGIFRLRQIVKAAGAELSDFNPRTTDPHDWDYSKLVGAEADGYLTRDEGDDQYGPSNNLKSLLVEI